MCRPLMVRSTRTHSSLRVGGAGNLSGKAFNKFYKRSTCYIRSQGHSMRRQKHYYTTLCGCSACLYTYEEGIYEPNATLESG